MQGKQKFKFL